MRRQATTKCLFVNGMVPPMPAPTHAEDRVALRALADAYAIAIDEGDGDAYLSTFVEDGALIAHLGRSGEPVAEFRGPEQLRTLALTTHESCLDTFHFVGNQRCEVDGDAASADTYCVAHHLMEGEGGAGPVDEVLIVHYVDACVRTDAGWRFEQRVAYRLWSETRQVVTRPLAVDRRLAAAMSARAV
jgi:SnoaL-like domain